MRPASAGAAGLFRQEFDGRREFARTKRVDLLIVHRVDGRGVGHAVGELEGVGREACDAELVRETLLEGLDLRIDAARAVHENHGGRLSLRFGRADVGAFVCLVARHGCGQHRPGLRHGLGHRAVGLHPGLPLDRALRHVGGHGGRGERNEKRGGKCGNPCVHGLSLLDERSCAPGLGSIHPSCCRRTLPRIVALPAFGRAPKNSETTSGHGSSWRRVVMLNNEKGPPSDGLPDGREPV